MDMENNAYLELRKKIDDKYDYYLREREDLSKQQSSLATNLDKLIFGLATGTIVLSVTFLDLLISKYNIDSFWMLKFSWCLLVYTLIANVITYPFALKAVSVASNKLDKWCLSKDFKAPNTSSYYGWFSNSFHFSSMVALVLGIIFLTNFALLNINPKVYMSDNQNEQKIDLKAMAPMQPAKTSNEVNIMPVEESPKENVNNDK